ncbi:MATE family efflux transporter [Tardiphaga sp. 839_C3_N1_4]|uniref:MATE family efflux transporter n=1 Tax=Tardiphaga sp. 839_C3_N1_4 TaxID=3240761 RepID=UPI003F21DD35
MSNIIRLAIPNTVVIAVQVMIGLLEIFFVSRLGVEALAGVSQVFPLVSLIVGVSQGAVGGGIVTSIARCLGRGEVKAASNFAWYALALSVVFGALTTAVMIAFGGWFYASMGAKGEQLEIASAYSTIIFGGAGLIWSFNLLMACVRGTGNLFVPVMVVCVGAVISVPVSLLLIYGGLGFSGVGPSGGAIAMLLYYAFGSLAYAWYLWSHRGVLRPDHSPPRLSLAPALKVLRIGGMSAIVGSTTNLTLAIVTAYVGLHGVQALAGYGAGSRLEFLLIPLSYGIGGPVGIIVSTNLGAGYIDRAVKASWLGILIAFGIAELVGVSAALFPETWISVFSGDPQVVAVGSSYLRIVGPFFGFFGMGYVLYCTGQATGRMTLSVLGALVRAGVAILGGYVLIVTGAGLRANFIAVSVGMAAFGLIALPALIGRVGYQTR